MRPHKSDLLDDAREIVFRRIAAENGTAEPRVKAAPPVGESGREDFGGLRFFVARGARLVCRRTLAVLTIPTAAR
jgi:hypothetical protein